MIDDLSPEDRDHENKLREFAASLLLDHCKRFEYLTVVKTAHDEKVFPEGLSDEDAEYVHDLILDATVRVSWPDHDYVFGTFEDDEDENDDDNGDRD